MNKKQIATAIKMSSNTISCELKRNSGTQGRYNYETAQKNAEYHKRRTSGNRAIKAEVKTEAIRLLKKKQWSPEQISGHLAKYEIFISHESIYLHGRRELLRI
ncbi:helix-turn-helix domain-containing protein [Segatella bryantii]|uniref:helix-turn-helix domain-containing protein n=1 Tax=Segatella bryantii TaxID=77095 RepID=UPI001EDAD0A8|nr:helix-turn-helix domain-containing protein [Segatella bryantii]UKK73434.1 helix-turn-helix domain-containing protein [Segatella bryantii]